MGGFIFIHKSDTIDYKIMQDAALDVFIQRGFADPHIVSVDNYVLLAFAKHRIRELALQQFPNGDFVFTCGTLFYDGAVGKAAAIAFYRNYDGSPGLRDRAMGHYTVILRKNGMTEIIPDSFGGYHVFCDDQIRIASSSFLAVASSLKRLTINVQSAYEFVFTGVVSGNATPFDEVILAPVNSTIAVRPQRMEIVGHPPPIPQIISSIDFETSIAHSMELFDRYFSSMATNFDDQVNCALSGGYDSRLILALLRRHGVRPSIYVYGSSDDGDVTLAQAIAKKEDFHLNVVDKTQYRSWEPDEFATVAHQNFLGMDGYSWGGIFNNGAEREERVLRVRRGMIVLNGGGGEILRNFFYLLNRSYTPREFLWSFYSGFDPRTCTALFDEKNYFHIMELKLEILTGRRFESFPRPVIEWLYHNFRCRTWDGRVNTINSTFGHSALPFLERPLTEHASAIPLVWKNHGAYEAELLRRADRRLAAYPSSYGHDFSGPPPLSRRLVDYGTYLRPPWARRFSYRIQHRVRRYAASSLYLTEPYVSAVLRHGLQVMPNLFLMEKVVDSAHIARILSLEYLIQQFAGRVCDNFQSLSVPVHCSTNNAETAEFGKRASAILS